MERPTDSARRLLGFSQHRQRRTGAVMTLPHPYVTVGAMVEAHPQPYQPQGFAS
jgi:hypothetical protein